MHWPKPRLKLPAFIKNMKYQSSISLFIPRTQLADVRGTLLISTIRAKYSEYSNSFACSWLIGIYESNMTFYCPTHLSPLAIFSHGTDGGYLLYEHQSLGRVAFARQPIHSVIIQCSVGSLTKRTLPKRHSLSLGRAGSMTRPQFWVRNRKASSFFESIILNLTPRSLRPQRFLNPLTP